MIYSILKKDGSFLGIPFFGYTSTKRLSPSATEYFETNKTTKQNHNLTFLF